MFKLHCDRCQKFVKTVGGPEAKQISLDGDVICRDCEKTEQKFEKMADKLKRSWDSKMNAMVAEAKEQVKELLKG